VDYLIYYFHLNINSEIIVWNLPNMQESQGGIVKTNPFSRRGIDDIHERGKFDNGLIILPVVALV